jgi:hypothetical protein
MDMENPTGHALFESDISAINNNVEAPIASHNEIKEEATKHLVNTESTALSHVDFTSDDLANDSHTHHQSNNGDDADDYDCDNGNNGSGNNENIDYSTNEHDENSDGQSMGMVKLIFIETNLNCLYICSL